MELRLGTAVRGVLVNEGRAHGVLLENKTEITGHAGISDIIAQTLYLDMVGEEHLPPLVRRGIRSYRPPNSAVMLCLGVDYRPPLFSHHTIITAPFEEMNDYWWDRFLKGAAEGSGVLGEDVQDERLLVGSPPKRQTPARAVWSCVLAHPVRSLPVPGGPPYPQLHPHRPIPVGGNGLGLGETGLWEQAVTWFSRRAIPGLLDHIKVAESLPLWITNDACAIPREPSTAYSRTSRRRSSSGHAPVRGP